MDRDLSIDALTPLERIELRELLQDRWRDQLQLITLLTLARYDVAIDDNVGSAGAPRLDAAALDLAIERGRGRLASFEEAMRRLDDRSYGWCVTCAGPIGLPRLSRLPEETVCDDCRDSIDAESRQSVDVGVA